MRSIWTCLGLCYDLATFCFCQLLLFLDCLATHLRHFFGNPWLYLGVVTAFEYILYHYEIILQIESCWCSFSESLCYGDSGIFIELIFTFDGQGRYDLLKEYSLRETIIFERGFLLDNFDEYHELVNPFVMKK